jgi:folate-binding protein YgfZ
VALAVDGTCAVIWVDGPDAASFLQGLLSNDVASLAAGGTCRALLLDAKGHVRADMRVARTAPDSFTIVADPEGGDGLAAVLDEYHFSEDVEIIGPEPAACVTVLDPPATAPALGDLVVPGLVPGTIDILGVDIAAVTAALEADVADGAVLETRRVEAGIGRFGVDITSANLVHEAALEDQAVSFTKGCFLGQETVARVQYRGGVKRRLVGVRLARAVAPGTPAAVGDRSVGTVTSVVVSPRFGPIGIGILRTDAAVGDEIAVNGTVGTVAELPFAVPA